MNLSKRKLRILFIALSILTILVVFLCSFAPPSFSSDTAIIVSRPSQIDIENLLSIVDLQYLTGTFNDLKPVCCFLNSSYNSIYLLLTNRKDYSLSIENSILSIPGQTDRFILTADGFTVHSIVGNGTVNIDRVLFYRPSYNEDLISNSSFTPSGSSNGQDSIAEIASYFSDFYNLIINFEEYISDARSEGESIGFDQGAEEGYTVGYEDGYNQGYDSGFADGEDRGYAEGQTEGYSVGYSEGYSEGESVGVNSGYRDGFDDGREEGFTLGYDSGYYDGYKRGEDIGHQTGYSEGYETGYESGFSDGYETGYQSGLNDGGVSEPLQIFTAYIFRFDENNSLQYFSYRDSLNIFSWVDYASGFDPTKPPYTFSVRLTESDLNNSSTQIELPFDFLSSPGNQDYSVGSFDPDFLTGYGKSLSLFVTTARSYNNGYNVGLQDGADLLDGISDISSKPISALRDALDFELFGVNIGLVVVALVSVLIVFAAYKFVKKLFPI